MQFDPTNPFVKLCLQGMAEEEKGNIEASSKHFMGAWDQAANELEKFIAAHYVTRHQEGAADQLSWLQTSLDLALKINEDSVNSALPAIYLNIAKCYEDLGETEKGKINAEIVSSIKFKPTDKGPFISSPY